MFFLDVVLFVHLLFLVEDVEDVCLDLSVELMRNTELLRLLLLLLLLLVLVPDLVSDVQSFEVLVHLLLLVQVDVGLLQLQDRA